MKKVVGFFGILLLANLMGCATHDFVRTQTDPLADRLSKLESTVSQLSAASDANKAALAQVNGKAQQALDLANKTSSEVRSAKNDADKAEAAALRAENAAKEAEQAAKESQQMERKSEKIFKLEQKK